MSTDSPLGFVVDKEAKTVSITKQFAAGLDLVWDVHTKAELLDQWWAPKPFASRTKVMDFTVGGRRFYAMVSPEGAERWVLQKYTSITPKTNFKLFNTFADADGNGELPGSDWNFDFTDLGEITKVSVSIYNESLERMERILDMGFVDGAKAQLQNLEELLKAMSLQRGVA